MPAQLAAAALLTLGSPWLAGASGPIWATYLGGSKGDSITALRVDEDGSVYVAGGTSSPDFPSPSASPPAVRLGLAFLTKLNPEGTAVLWTKFFDFDYPPTIRFGTDGYVYLNGYLPPGTDFSVTPGAVNQAGGEQYLMKLSWDGSQVLAAARLAGLPGVLATDAQGNVYLAGSAKPGFPTTPGAVQSRSGGGTCSGLRQTYPCPDAYVLKLNAGLTRVEYATLLGGSYDERVTAVAVDSAGNAVVLGETGSRDFPVTAGAIRRSFGGLITFGPLWYGDAFLAKLDPTGRRLIYSTYLGGRGADTPYALQIDGAGNAYAAGATQSEDFPTTEGVFQRIYAGPASPPPASLGDGFISKFDPGGALVYSTLVGGPGFDAITGFALDAEGNAYLNMAPGSPAVGRGLPNRCAAPAPSLSKLNPTATSLETFHGPAGKLLALDRAGNLYTAGPTTVLTFLATPGAYQTRYGGGDTDGFVAKIDPTGQPAARVTCVANAASLIPGLTSFFPLGTVAPGEIVSIFGILPGPQPDTRVLFDGLTTPLLYAGDGQINAVAPFGIAGPVTKLVVESQGRALGPYELPVNDVVPAIFTQSGDGEGPGAILNEDGSINSTANPAAPGSIIQIFATGAGPMDPPQKDGEITSLQPPFPRPRIGVSVLIAYRPAEVLYAGAAPGLVAGAVQVNARVPEGVQGVVPISIHLGDYASQFSVTVAVGQPASP